MSCHHQKGQNRLHLLRRLRSFRVCSALLRTSYYAVVASAIFYIVVCWRGGRMDRDRSVLWKMAKLTSVMDNISHPYMTL